MTIIPLAQRSPAWYAWRCRGLGSSDAAIVWHGAHFRRTLVDLWREKTGLVTSNRADNPAMRRGSRLEPAIRRWYEGAVGLVAPPVCAEYDEHSWLRASLDGWVADAGIAVEIKSIDYDSHGEALSGKVPAKYEAQLWHQALVTGARLTHFVTFNPRHEPGSQFAFVEVRPDPARLQELLDLETVFWHHITTCTPPPSHLREPPPARTPPSQTAAGVSVRPAPHCCRLSFGPATVREGLRSLMVRKYFSSSACCELSYDWAIQFPFTEVVTEPSSG